MGAEAALRSYPSAAYHTKQDSDNSDNKEDVNKTAAAPSISISKYAYSPDNDQYYSDQVQ
jgi:hypothetical protein